MAGAGLNDHIKMVTRNGKEKQVPIWQVKQWIGAGVFKLNLAKGNEVGYDFVDQKRAIADIEAFDADEARRRANKVQGSGIPEPVDQGIAGLTFARKSANASAFGSPPMPEVGEETVRKASPPAKPQDVI